MALMQKDLHPFSLPDDKAQNEKVTEEADKAANADAQDEEQWQNAFAASQDTLSSLAAQARAHREAGRTRKISG